MKYWWASCEGERGIVPAAEQSHFRIGRESHHDFACIMEGESARDAYARIQQLRPPDEASIELKEQWCRRLGWATSFATFIAPEWLAHHVVIMVEKELILERGQLWVPSTADLVLEMTDGPNKGLLKVIDFKSLAMQGKSWDLHWPYAIQMHLQIEAVEQELKRKVACAVVVGMKKGDKRYGRLDHPYIYAYYDDHTDSWRPDYKYGWTRRGLWEYPGDLFEWVVGLGAEVASHQFPQSHPIFYDKRLVDLLAARRIYRLNEIRDVKEECRTNLDKRAIYFEHRFKKCRPEFGLENTECPYLAACHNSVVGADPIGSTLYVPRTPHHDAELMIEKEFEDE